MRPVGKALAVVIILVVIALIAFFAPVIFVTKTDATAFGAQHISFTATVSVTYYLFDCGFVLSPTATSTTFGYQTGESIAATGVYCSIDASPSPG